MDSIDFQQIISLLAPRSGIPLLFDILLYAIFFLLLIGLFLQSDKTVIPTLIISATMLMTVIAKLGVFSPREFGTLAINAGIFTLPAFSAGITRAPKSRPWLIIASVLGCIHLFVVWFFQQSGMA